MRDIHLSLKIDFADILDGRRLLSPSIRPDDECVLLAVDEEDVPAARGYAEVARARAAKRHITVRRSVDGVVLIADGSNVQKIPIAKVRFPQPFLQTLPNGNLLLVGARSLGTADRNAHVYSSDGTLQREITLGDGIEDVQTTKRGDIWVSYFDEGILGNQERGREANTLHVGASGLVQFDSQGRKLMEFVPPSGFDRMIACYALNVFNDQAWAYYHPEFSLVRVSAGGETRGWRTGLACARAFATEGWHVLLFGGYGSQKERCVLGELGRSELQNLSECRLLLPSGEICSGARVRGRGALLHVFTNMGWYQVNVRDLG